MQKSSKKEAGISRARKMRGASACTGLGLESEAGPYNPERGTIYFRAVT